MIKPIPLLLAVQRTRVSLPCADLTFATTIAAKKRKPPPRLHFQVLIIPVIPSATLFDIDYISLVFILSSLQIFLHIKKCHRRVQICTSERGSSPPPPELRMGPGHSVRNAVRNGVRRVRQLTHDFVRTTTSS